MNRPAHAVEPTEIVRGMELSGQLQLHEITATVESPLLTAMVKVLADLYGKEPREIVRVAKNDDISFEVKDGRLIHDGLRIGFPDISPELVVTSHGSVGLDRSLDLTLEVPETLAKLGGVTDDPSRRIQYRISGTIDLPLVVEVTDDTP